MNKQVPSKKQIDISLFNTNVHSPSYASLTNNFELAYKLKDYCIPVNSYFPTKGIMDQLYSKLPFAIKYYPGSNGDIAKTLCQFAGISNPETVVVGNGSTELISWINTLFIKESIMIPVPSFGRWTDEPQALGIDVKFLHYNEEKNNYLTAEEFVSAVKSLKVKNAVLCNPNNPTGTILQKDDVIWIMEQLTHLDNLIIDESFIDFSHAEIPTVKDEVSNFKNAWVLKSLGKNLGLHGLRMGYVISCTDNIKNLKTHVPFWNVNGITELLLKLIVDEKAEYEKSRMKVIEDREYLKKAFEVLPAFKVFPTSANFIYVKLAEHINGDVLRDRLLLNGDCFVRNCGNKIGCTSQYFRIASRPKEDVDFLVAAVKKELEQLELEAGYKEDIIWLNDISSRKAS